MNKKNIIAFLIPVFLLANPIKDSILGNANLTYSKDGKTLTINQSSEKAIINWKDFSIDKGEITKFLQPTNGICLNRVISKNPTKILGSLLANGKIWLINQNGILVGNGAYIKTKGFLASTLDLGNEDFFLTLTV